MNSVKAPRPRAANPNGYKHILDQLTISQLHGIIYWLESQFARWQHEQQISDDLAAMASCTEDYTAHPRYCRQMIGGIRHMLYTVKRHLDSRMRKAARDGQTA